MKISVVGLGKLGYCTAACFANKYDTTGIDIDERKVSSLNNKTPILVEPGINKLVKKNAKRLSATSNYAEIMDKTDITFIIVPTPSKTDGKFSNEFVIQALTDLSHNFTKKKRHIFVVVSTVMPGSSEEFIRVIENESGKTYGKDFGVLYNPEFIAIGSIIHDFLNPDIVLIGGDNKDDIKKVQHIYENICKNKPYFSGISFLEAEISKLALNNYVTMKISFANMLGEISENFGVNVDNITTTLGNDKRVSPYYFKSGLPFGGTCFPRDVRAFKNLFSYNKTIPSTTDAINERTRKRIVSKIVQHARGIKKIVIVGATYKSGTPVIEESPALFIASDLLKNNVSVHIIDSSDAIKNMQDEYGDRFHYMGMQDDSAFYEDAIFLLNYPPKNFIKKLLKYSKSNKFIVIDFWRKYKNTLQKSKNIIYLQ